MANDKIIIKGAREHNLKNINLTLPREKLIVMTGLSGSGKSSLAFDTIYADGQRRYVESLSSYARMFLGRMDKPDVDEITGLSPAISIDQKTTSHNPRSTVGTVTEIYDYLRLLYARIGVPHCPVCGRVISQQTVDEMVDAVLKLEDGTKFQILAPVVRQRKGTQQKELDAARRAGYARVKIDGNLYDLDEEISLEKNIKHTVEIVVDRLALRKGIRSRLADSLETALALTGGLTYQMVIPMVMGLNIGTCATSLISSIGTSYKAKRVAVIHFSIKVIGTIICLPLYLLFTSLLKLDFIYNAVTPWNIAMVHTIYNLAITAILMPFTKYLVKLGKWLVKAKDETAPKDAMQYAPDLLLLRSPSVALQECDHYTFRMAATARDSLERAISLVGAYNEKDAEVVMRQEDTLDLYEDRLDAYLVYLSAQALSQQDSRRVGKMQHAIGDFERLGDHAVNLVKAGKELEIKSLFFSEEARRELGVLTMAVREILQLTTDCYINTDHEMAHHVEPLEQVIDGLTKAIKKNHLARLQAGRCSIELGFILSDLLTDFERISDHCSNIAVAVIELQHDALDSHRYLNEMKRDSEAFREMYAGFREKYVLPESAYARRQMEDYRSLPEPE